MTQFEAIDTETPAIDPSAPVANHPEIERSSQVGFNAEELVPRPTYVEAGIEKLTALCGAVGLADKTSQAIEIFRALTASWGDRRVGELAGWESNVSDDGTPFEFSIAFTAERAELRVLVEAQGAEPNLQSNWEAGLQLNQYLADNYHASLDRFRQVEDLYAPHNPDAKFAIWHSACFYPDKEPEFKLYLNPQSRRSSLAAAVVEESLVRLGFTHAWPTLADTAAQRGPEQDEFVYFSLDLSTHARARVKVYIRHHDATVDDLEKALSAATNYVSGDATDFCHSHTQSVGAFNSKPLVSCFSFVDLNHRPMDGTLYIPIGYYTSEDRAVVNYLRNYFNQNKLPLFLYTKAIDVFTNRALESGSGMHSHISFRRKNQQRWVSVYLNPEIHGFRPVLNIQQINNKQRPSIDSIAISYEKNSISDHPFLQRLQREPANLSRLWLIFANGREGIVSDFTRRLASVVGRIDSEQIRCILTKQLNEELGNGDISRVHRKLFDRLILALDPYKPASITEKTLLPGYKLSDRLEKLYYDPNPYVGIGAAIVMEIFGKQIDEVMGKEFVTKTDVNPSSLLWLHLHEELEIGHSDEALELANIVANSNRDEDADAAQQGAEMTVAAMWGFFNGIYRLCFL